MEGGEKKLRYKEGDSHTDTLDGCWPRYFFRDREVTLLFVLKSKRFFILYKYYNIIFKSYQFNYFNQTFFIFILYKYYNIIFIILQVLN